jgi:hypothetical protein
MRNPVQFSYIDINVCDLRGDRQELMREAR